MNLKHVESLAEGAVSLRLFGRIGFNSKTGEGISGPQMASEISYLDAEPDINELVILINSEGGSVTDALSICAAIRSCKTPVRTVVDGLAASAAAFVAVCGDTREMVDFGRIMVHNPSYTGKEREDMDEKTLEGLDQFAQMIAEITSKKSGKTVEEMLALMDAETWLNAEDALKAGMIDEIIPTEVEAILDGIDWENAELSAIVNEIPTRKIKAVDIKAINAKLGLDSGASIEAVGEKVTAILKENKELKASLATAQNAEARLAAEKVVDEAIEAGKVAKENRDFLVGQGVESLDSLTTFLKNQPTPATKVVDALDRSGEEDGKVVDGKLNGKSLRDLEKEDPEKVVNLQANDWDTYSALFEAEYGATPTKD